MTFQSLVDLHSILEKVNLRMMHSTGKGGNTGAGRGMTQGHWAGVDDAAAGDLVNDEHSPCNHVLEGILSYNSRASSRQPHLAYIFRTILCITKLFLKKAEFCKWV